MIYLVYRGLGSKYTQYIRDGVKRLNRLRSTQMMTETACPRGYKIAIDKNGSTLTVEHLQKLLEKPELSFFISDSRGLPDEILNTCHETVSLSKLPINHQMEIAILVEGLEKALKQRQKL